MAADLRDLQNVNSGEAALQLPLDPLVYDPAWSFLPSSPVVGLPGQNLDAGTGGGEVPPLPTQAPAGLGLLEMQQAAAKGGVPSQCWEMGPMAAATAQPLLVNGGAPMPLGAGPFAVAPQTTALQLGMPAAVLPASVGSPALLDLAAGPAAPPLCGGDGGIVGPFAPAPALTSISPPAAILTGASSPAGIAALTLTEPAMVVVDPLPPPPPQQQQQAAERAGRRSGGGRRSTSAPRSRSRGGGRRSGGRGRSRAAADTDSDYEVESAPSSDGEAGDESEEDRAAIEARRKERLRAKNRRAQARYRLKQKAMYEQQAAKLEAAAADIERQRLANEALRDRGAALEKITSFKDLSLQALHAAGGQAAAATGASHLNPLPAPPTLRELHSGDSGSGAATVAVATDVSSAASSGVQQLKAATTASQPDALRPAASNASTEAGSSEGGGNTSSGGGSRRRPFEQRAEELTALANREQSSGLATQEAMLMQQIRGEVLGMTADDFLQDWADFGTLAAQTLAELDGGHISEQQAAARLGPAVQYRSLLHTAMLHYRPEVYKQLLAHTHLPEESPEEAAERWRSVALAMGCTRSQALQLREQYQAYCARLRQLSADSAACVRHLTSLAQEQLGPGLAQLGGGGKGEGGGEEGSFLAGRSLRSMMTSYLQLFEAAQRLAHQPDAALVALLEFHTATGSIVSGMQKARCAALYKPLFPDIVAIVRTCLEQHGLLPPDTGASPAVAAPAPPTAGGQAYAIA